MASTFFRILHIYTERWNTNRNVVVRPRNLIFQRFEECSEERFGTRLGAFLQNEKPPKPRRPCTPLGTRTLDTLIKRGRGCIIMQERSIKRFRISHQKRADALFFFGFFGLTYFDLFIFWRCILCKSVLASTQKNQYFWDAIRIKTGLWTKTNRCI